MNSVTNYNEVQVNQLKGSVYNWSMMTLSTALSGYLRINLAPLFHWRSRTVAPFHQTWVK